ncbi:MAG TPA: SIS domain-containing protein [Candidatus Nanoarchaeia archaeon]|nr:SIS domain-containing protein [Candidatus Nanoarchaeia archaeon]
MPDRYNMIEHLVAFPDQILEAKDIGASIALQGPIKAVLITGAPGSVGHLIKSAAGDAPVPIMVSTDLSLPKWVDDKTLVFLISHTEDGDETAELFNEALRRRAGVIAITSGGKVESTARDKGKTFIKVPRRGVPRNAAADIVLAACNILSNANLLGEPLPDVSPMATVLKNDEWRLTAKDLSSKLLNKVPMIITSEKMRGIGERWKEVLSNNSKVHAISSVISDLDQIEGFANLQARIQVIMIQDEADSNRQKKLMQSAKKAIEDKGVQVTAIRLKGSAMGKVLSAIHLGDMTSYVLSQLYDCDPTPTIIKDGVLNSSR